MVRAIKAAGLRGRVEDAFEIGLWVGKAATPNRMGSKDHPDPDSARAKAILALREAGQKPAPDQVLGGGPDGGRAITITKVRQDLKRQGLADATVWYDLGEDTTPASWITPFLDSEVDRERAAGNRTTAPKVLNRLWIDWLEANRGDVPNREYWMGAWGTFDRLRMHPDSSSDAARAAPKLYVDSLIFYEELLLKQLRQTSSWLRLQLGKDTHVGVPSISAWV